MIWSNEMYIQVWRVQGLSCQGVLALTIRHCTDNLPASFLLALQQLRSMDPFRTPVGTLLMLLTMKLPPTMVAFAVRV